MKILVTGAAGFIGQALSEAFLKRGDHVVGIDNMNDYYAVTLKESRLERLKKYDQFEFHKLDLADRAGMEALFQNNQFDRVVNLAAQAGVRYSIENPHAYIDSNIVGFLNILEGCRHSKVPHLVYASSSSVFGANKEQPFSETHNVDHPVSLYAASKKSNELMAHAYSSLYKLPTTGLRFFTVYGPWGRPDMAPILFTKGIVEGQPINIFNNGDMERDFTYIDDIVEGVIRVTDKIPAASEQWDGHQPDPSSSYCPYKVYNIGNNTPVRLMDFVQAIENALGKTAEKNMMPMQPGDVPSTCADVSSLERDVGFKPATSIEDGINKFVAWYRDYYKV
ncbi:NAD-dependent epimerase [Teredinibacter franksiae]|jgi:Nucleoside-diphosphate-sugar epimerases|uniref:NAD-dependent epimerase n=1 Tax=Teredinibacter franksiae TaxID=2761453 RepID=UPI00162651D0|nr:NAD-dependent epimerase [Teredinibacter franksiae]